MTDRKISFWKNPLNWNPNHIQWGLLNNSTIELKTGWLRVNIERPFGKATELAAADEQYKSSDRPADSHSWLVMEERGTQSCFNPGVVFTKIPIQFFASKLRIILVAKAFLSFKKNLNLKI